MLAQGSITLPHPSHAVAAALTADGEPWSVALDGGGRELLSRVGITIGRLELYKQVQLEIGVSAASVRRERLMLPVSWKAAGGPPIFPSMEGTLHVEPEGAEATRLTLNARYDPPLGRLGQLVDRVLMHRIAEITMADFTARLAAELNRRLEG